MRYTTKRNGKNVIPLLMGVRGLNLPHWKINRVDDMHGFLSGDAADKLAAYEDAEEQRLLVRLPCKVGDTVFRYSHLEQRIQFLKCEGFLFNGTSWKVRCTDFIPSWVGNQKRHFYITASSFGKTVFLSREEAEAALKKAEK